VTQRQPLWLIDLDNTLYDASWRVMGEINQRMTQYVATHLSIPLEEASQLRSHYWQRYGATILGMVRHHQVCPKDFLQRTHPGDNLPDFILPIKGERRRLSLLRGRRWLLTNAPRAYAERVLAIMGLQHFFEKLISIEDMKLCGRLRPKPAHLIWRHVARLAKRHPRQLTLIDDHSENLKAAHRAGMKTARIFVSKTMRQRARDTGRPLGARRPSYVHVQVHSVASLARAQQKLHSR
jgi:putative hydrolase of the HAD superfamily